MPYHRIRLTLRVSLSQRDGAVANPGQLIITEPAPSPKVHLEKIRERDFTLRVTD